LSEVNDKLQHVISAGASESQLPVRSGAHQAAEAEKSQDMKIYIPYESAELCIAQVK